MIPLDEVYPLEVLTQIASAHMVHPGVLWDMLSSAAQAYDHTKVGKDRGEEAKKREMQMLAERIEALATELGSAECQRNLMFEAGHLAQAENAGEFGGAGDDEIAQEAWITAGQLVQSDVEAVQRLATIAKSAATRNTETGRAAQAKLQASAHVLMKFWIEDLEREAGFDSDDPPSQMIVFLFDCLAPLGIVRNYRDCAKAVQKSPIAA